MRSVYDWTSEWGQKQHFESREKKNQQQSDFRKGSNDQHHRPRYGGKALRKLVVNQNRQSKVKLSPLQIATVLPQDPPLFMAAFNNWSDGIENLVLDGGEKVDQRDHDISHYTPLHIAIICGHLESVKTLVRLGADISLGDRYGHNALHFAGVGRSKEILCFLLDVIAKMSDEKQQALLLSSSKSKDAVLPLQNALLHSTDCEIIDLLMIRTNDLLEALAQKEVVKYEESLGGWGEQDGEGETEDQMDDDTITGGEEQGSSSLALSSNNKRWQGAAVVNLKNSANWSPLQILLKNGRLEVVKYFVEKWLVNDKCDPERRFLLAALEEKNDDKWTALHHAVNKGHAPVVEYLLQLGANPNVKNLGGWTPLHIAARNCDERSVDLLLKGGADPSLRSDPLWTPLHVASQKDSSTRVVRLLLEGGSDPNASTLDDWTPAKLMVHGGQADSFELLVKFGLDLTPKPVPNNSTLWTPLHNVAAANELTRKSKGEGHNRRPGLRRNHLSATTSTTTSYNYNSAGTTGSSNIDALEYENPQAKEPLLRVGRILVDASLAGPQKSKLYLPIDSRTKAQWTALHTAAKSGFIEFVKILVEEGKADVNAQTEEGRTPLHCALSGSSHRCVEVAKYLIELGPGKIDLSIEADQGGCAIHFLRCLKKELKQTLYPLIRAIHGQEAFDNYTSRYQRLHQRDVNYVPPHYAGTTTERMQELKHTRFHYLSSKHLQNIRQKSSVPGKDLLVPFKKVMQSSGIQSHLFYVYVPTLKVLKQIQQPVWHTLFEHNVDLNEPRFRVDLIPGEDDESEVGRDKKYQHHNTVGERSGTVPGRSTEKESHSSPAPGNSVPDLSLLPSSYPDSSWITVFLGRPLDPKKSFPSHLIDQVFILARSCSPVLFSKSSSNTSSQQLQASMNDSSSSRSAAQASTTDFHRCIHHLNSRLASDLVGFRQAFSDLDLELWIQIEAIPYPEVWQMNDHSPPTFSQKREEEFWANTSKPWRRTGPRIPSRLSLKIYDELFTYSDEDYMHRLPEKFYFASRIAVKDTWSGSVDRIVMFGPQKGHALNTIGAGVEPFPFETPAATPHGNAPSPPHVRFDSKTQDALGEVLGQWQFSGHSSLICYMKTLPHVLKYTRGVLKKVIHLRQQAQKERIAKIVEREKRLLRKAAEWREWES